MQVQRFESVLGNSVDCSAVEIAAERVLLRPIVEEDAPEIFATFDAEVTRYMTPHPPAEIGETLEFITRSRRGMEEGNNMVFAITLKETGDFLGTCGLHGEGHERTPRKPELGIWIKKGAQGHGYGREAIFALVHWVEENLIVDFLWYPVDRANVPSRKIPEAIGGVVVKEEVSPTLDGRVLDILFYKIPARKIE